MKKKTILIWFIAYSSIVSGKETSLEGYLIKVQKQNLNIKIELIKQSISNEKSIGLNLPPPMIGITRGKDDLENTSSGLEISQEIPFPSKLKADHEARILASKAQEEIFKSNRNKILSKAKFAYHNLWIAQKKVELKNHKKKILKSYINLTRSTIRSSNTVNIYLLKIESDLEILENEIESATQSFKEKKYVLAELVNEDLITFDIEVNEPPISSIPMPPNINRDDTIPQISSGKFIVRSLEARENEANKSWTPDFSLKFKQMNGNLMSGKYREFMLGITLPFVYFWEPKSMANQATYEKVQAELELNREKRNINNTFIKYLLKLESLQNQLSNLKNKLIPNAKERIKLIQNIAPRDMDSIRDHLETTESLSNLQLMELDLRMQYEEGISELENYIPFKDQANE